MSDGFARGPVLGRVVTVEDILKQRIAELEARYVALKGAVREYLGEWDTPAKDYAYRARCRERLREWVLEDEQ